MRILSAVLLLATLAKAQDSGGRQSVKPDSAGRKSVKKDAPPKSTADVERIVHDYLMEHPEVILQAVTKYQENQRADDKKKAQQTISTNRPQLVADPNSPVGGSVSPDAVIVVEFFDYRCGYCKRMAPTIAKYVSGSKIRLVYKELPILGPDSIVAAKAALAARRQRGDVYAKFHQDLMSLEGTITLAAIERVATKNNLDFARLKTDMETPEIKAQIDATQKLAELIGVNATPSFVIGNEMFPGAMDEQEFQSNIAKAQKH